MAKHTMSDLYQMQSLPLSAKIRMTEYRIREWEEEHGEDGVYVSFSGGKDSTVLLHIARNLYPNMKAVFVDTGLEYPEIREFVKTFDNVDWLRPKTTFKQVIEKYGYPFISKEVSKTVDYARKYVKALQTDRQIMGSAEMADILGIDRRKVKDNEEYQKIKKGIIPSKIIGSFEYDKMIGQGKYAPKPNCYYQMLNGTFERKEKGVPTGEISNMYNKSRYKFFLEADFNLSASCCSVMKKAPINSYAKSTGRKAITAQMASESKLRTTNWLKNGCNGFEMKKPISNPMSFWTEQDVLLYIKEKNLPIASVYGEIVVDYEAEGQLDGQMDLFDLGIFEKQRRPLKTTGCNRTGCMFCGYGCHLEQSPNRFERMKETHPKQYDFIMRPKEEGGLGYREVIDWINENGNMNIKY